MGWSLEQEKYLVDNYGKIDTKEMSKKLRKSVNYIYVKADRLGINQKENKDKGLSLELIKKQKERKAKLNETKELIDNTLIRLGV